MTVQIQAETVVGGSRGALGFAELAVEAQPISRHRNSVSEERRMQLLLGFAEASSV
jgi:hypothetical protein